VDRVDIIIILDKTAARKSGISPFFYKQVAFCVLFVETVDPNLLQVHRVGNSRTVKIVGIDAEFFFENEPLLLENSLSAFSLR
jgi:hypothetical protein